MEGTVDTPGKGLEPILVLSSGAAPAEVCCAALGPDRGPMSATSKSRVALAIVATLIAAALTSSPTQASTARSRAGGWSAPQLIDPVFVPRAVSCTGQSACVMVGCVSERSLSGHSWRGLTVFDPRPVGQGLDSSSLPAAKLRPALEGGGYPCLYRVR